MIEIINDIVESSGRVTFADLTTALWFTIVLSALLGCLIAAVIRLYLIHKNNPDCLDTKGISVADNDVAEKGMIDSDNPINIIKIMLSNPDNNILSKGKYRLRDLIEYSTDIKMIEDLREYIEYSPAKVKIYTFLSKEQLESKRNELYGTVCVSH